MANPVIRFSHVSKRFTLHRERARSFQDLVLSRLQRRNGGSEAFWALRDVSLLANQGEMLGLIGPNGAGKSTILKLMTRILEPTSGAINVQGRVAALLELGTGFHPDLTGRENIFLNGSLMGFSRRQMQQRLDGIVDFAGMEEFIDVPVRHYSSGMYMRLGFAIAAHSDPDILITDEVLAVGDEAFQNKCLERMSAFRDQGVTIVLVSHALPIVRKLCSRVVWLQHGSVVMDGPTDMVIDSYVADVAAGQEAAHPHDGPIAPALGSVPAVQGLADVRMVGVEMLGPDGAPRWQMAAGEKMKLRVSYQIRKPLLDAVVTLQVYDADDQSVICAFNSHQAGLALSLRAGVGSIDLADLPLPLRCGRYLLSVALYDQPDPPAWANPSDLHHKAYTFHVDSALKAPCRRWGTGEALLDSLRMYGAAGEEQSDFMTGETIRLRLRCMSTGKPVENPVLRVQIFDSRGVLCHATNTERSGLKLGVLPGQAVGQAGFKEVVLTYEHLDLLEGDYVLSAGLWPTVDALLPYDWHDAAYRFHVHSEHKHGDGLLALRHQWTASD